MKNTLGLDKNSPTITTPHSPEIVNDPDLEVEMKYLARSWLDQFEKDVFEGKTIVELLDTRTYE